jgi:hypothetical protein
MEVFNFRLPTTAFDQTPHNMLLEAIRFLFFKMLYATTPTVTVAISDELLLFLMDLILSPTLRPRS